MGIKVKIDCTTNGFNPQPLLNCLFLSGKVSEIVIDKSQENNYKKFKSCFVIHNVDDVKVDLELKSSYVFNPYNKIDILSDINIIKPTAGDVYLWAKNQYNYPSLSKTDKFTAIDFSMLNYGPGDGINEITKTDTKYPSINMYYDKEDAIWFKAISSDGFSTCDKTPINAKISVIELENEISCDIREQANLNINEKLYAAHRSAMANTSVWKNFINDAWCFYRAELLHKNISLKEVDNEIAKNMTDGAACFVINKRIMVIK